MNNWGRVSQQYYTRHSRRARARHATAMRRVRSRRALIDDEDVSSAGPQVIHTSLDGFCREQQLRIEADLNRRVQRVRTAQMAHVDEGWDDEIPTFRRRAGASVPYRGADWVQHPFADG